MKEYQKKNREVYKDLYHNDISFRTKILASSYKSQDFKKGFDVSNNVDGEFVEKMLKNGCVYCGETDWHELGCDRIDNSKGHSMDNVVCACRLCNWVRNNHFSFTEMLILGKAIRNIKELRHQRQN